MPGKAFFVRFPLTDCRAPNDHRFVAPRAYSILKPQIQAKGLSHIPNSTSLYRCRLHTWVQRLGSWLATLRSFLQCGQPSAARSFISVTFIIPAGVLLTSCFSNWAEWCFKTREQIMFPNRLINGTQVVIVNCRRALVHPVVVYQTHTATSCTRARC